ncbi:hypothetical protein [Treponema sp.]|nr:hypothetical protein [Treponema sp.]
MDYKKPNVLAQNGTTGVYAASCPFEGCKTPMECRYCEHNA